MNTAPATLRQPRPHQATAVEQLKLWNGRGLVGDDMGLGKSSTALWALAHFDVYPLVIVCPLSVVDKWANEVEVTLGESWSVSVLSHNATKRTTENMRRVRILHWERLLRLGPLELDSLCHSVMAEPPKTGLILDEVHRIKNRSCDTSLQTALLAYRCRHVLGLSGTLMRRDVRDLWHPAHVTRPGSLGTYSSFEARYTRQTLIHIPGMLTKNGKKRYIRKFLGDKNEDELKGKLANIVIRRLKGEVENLPPKIRDVIPLEMGKVEQKRYDEMRHSAMVTLQNALGQDASVIARTKLEQWIRLEQLTCGILGSSTGGKPNAPACFPDCAKIAWAVETINELVESKRSVAVFCKYNATIAMLMGLCDKVEHRFAMTGSTPPDIRNNVLRLFRHTKGGVLFCQLKIAEGFDLTPASSEEVGCTDGIFLGIDWTPAPMDQAEDRMHRIGTLGTVNCYYPIVKSSIDIRLHRTVIERREDARRVLDINTVMEELTV